MTIGFSVNDADTCCIRMDLYKKGVFAQPPTQEDGPDIMSCFFHGLENMTCTELKPKKNNITNIRVKVLRRRLRGSQPEVWKGENLQPALVWWIDREEPGLQLFEKQTGQPPVVVK